MLQDRGHLVGGNSPNFGPRSHAPRTYRPDDERHPDNHQSYRRPRAWLNAKRAFGVRPDKPNSGGEPGRALVLLERFGRDDCRRLLAIAVHLYLSVSPEAQTAAAKAYNDECDANMKAWLEDRKAKAAAEAKVGGEGTVSNA